MAKQPAGRAPASGPGGGKSCGGGGAPIPPPGRAFKGTETEAVGTAPETPLAGGNPLNAATAPPEEETEMPAPGDTWLDALSSAPPGPCPPSSISVSSAATSLELP